MRQAVFSSLLLLLAAGGCAHANIEGTTIEDTKDNRELLALFGKVREAMQNRDAEMILSMVSKNYFEDMGTVDPKDDFDFERLKTKVLPASMEITKEFKVDFEVHAITVDGDYAFADVRFWSRMRLDMPAGPLKETHKDFNRVEFAREDGVWRITSGL